MKETRTRKSFGLLHRRNVLVPTRRGWLMLLLLTALLAGGFIRSIQPFLAMNAPANGGGLVVEGWVPDYALQAAVDEFRRRDYNGFYVTGIPLWEGAALSEYKTYAERGAAVVARLGLKSSLVHAVPTPDVLRDHTYASAVALKTWLAKHGREVRSLTIVSVGTHARRTRLLYQKAFGPGVEIGIIAVPDRGYDPSHWWASSAGVREVLYEMLAYLYDRLLFRPS